MRCRSAYSCSLDPYRAGAELGMQLKEIQPELIFLFPTIHYPQRHELLEGLHDTIANPDLRVIGNSGDGFYEKSQVGNAGVSGLAIHGGGKIRMEIVSRTGLMEDPRETSEACLQELMEKWSDNSMKLIYLATDFRTDSSQVVSALQTRTKIPIVGGSAGDDQRFVESYQIADQEVLEDGIVMLGLGGDIEFDLRMAHSRHPVGRPGEITGISGSFITTINDQAAMTFVEQQLGKPLDSYDEGIVTLTLSEEPEGPEARVRSVLVPRDGEHPGSLQLFGGMKRGQHIQINIASAEDLLRDIAIVSRKNGGLSFSPQAGIIVSCAGRKKVLGARIHREVDAVMRRFPDLEALAGFPSYGEYGSVKRSEGYSPVYFHNMTLLLLLLGENTA